MASCAAEAGSRTGWGLLRGFSRGAAVRFGARRHSGVWSAATSSQYRTLRVLSPRAGFEFHRRRGFTQRSMPRSALSGDEHPPELLEGPLLQWSRSGHGVTSPVISTTSKSEPLTWPNSLLRAESFQRASGAPVTYQLLPLSATSIP